MSLDINELVRAVKQAAVEAVKADGPMAVSFWHCDIRLPAENPGGPEKDL